jgi:hypothetical protein
MKKSLAELLKQILISLKIRKPKSEITKVISKL